MKIRVENVTWNYMSQEEWDHFSGRGLGFGYVGIPLNMLKNFVKECGWDHPTRQLVPHYGLEETRDAFNMGSIHECYNSDTQIVLMNWLYDRRYHYKLDYVSSDPYWIYHDMQHSKWDVHGSEVCCISSRVEHDRLISGAEMSIHYKRSILGRTLYDLEKAWRDRFKWSEQIIHPFDAKEFFPFMSKRQVDEYCKYHEHPWMIEEPIY